MQACTPADHAKWDTKDPSHQRALQGFCVPLHCVQPFVGRYSDLKVDTEHGTQHSAVQGLRQRREASHGLNERSSRSHTIFTLRLDTLSTGAKLNDALIMHMHAHCKARLGFTA